MTCLAPAIARAAEPERYSYLFLQGKVSARKQNRPEGGVTVRVTSPTQTFETRTDERGVFVFERLPVASYDLQMITADGKVMRSIRSSAVPRGIRLEVKTGTGEGRILHMDASLPSGRVTYDVTEPAPDWKKFWTEFGVVVGAAGLFAL
jgi:hypothetical protein